MIIDKFDSLRETNVENGSKLVDYIKFVKMIATFIMQDLKDDVVFNKNIHGRETYIRHGRIRAYFLLLEDFVCGKWDSVTTAALKGDKSRTDLGSRSNMNILDENSQICITIKEHLKANIIDLKQLDNIVSFLLYTLGSSKVRELPALEVDDIEPIIKVLDLLLAFPCDYFVQLYVVLGGDDYDIAKCNFKDLNILQKKITLLHYYLYAPTSVAIYESEDW
jgi:hypothetical protein